MKEFGSLWLVKRTLAKLTVPRCQFEDLNGLFESEIYFSLESNFERSC